MAKRKRKRKKGFGNNPFDQLDHLIPVSSPSQTKNENKTKLASPPKISEDEFFAQAMVDVIRLPNQNVTPAAKKPSPSKIRDDEQEALRQLDDLVQGKEKFELVYSDEYVEGSVQGLDPRILQRLREGEYAWQAYFDLHGMRVEEAKEHLTEFIRSQHNKGRRCLLVIHGRGHHSPNQEPILKKRLIRWLSRGFLHKHILAFSSARPYDGGLGALYLLLRKVPKT